MHTLVEIGKFARRPYFDPDEYFQTAIYAGVDNLDMPLNPAQARLDHLYLQRTAHEVSSRGRPPPRRARVSAKGRQLTERAKDSERARCPPTGPPGRFV